MTNIMTSVQAYISGLGLYSSLYIDQFTGNSEEMVIRHDPSSAKVNAYMDRSREGEFNFSLYAKSQNAEVATNQLSELITALDLAGGLKLSSLVRIKLEPVGSVRFVSKTEKLEYIYSADFRVEYFQRGK